MTLKIFCKCTVIAGSIIIIAIKFAVRPYYHFAQPIKYLLGIAPNLLGAFLLPFGCYWLLNKFINLHSAKQFKWFCRVCFVLLVINELLQLIPVFGRTFDYNDIAASATGLISAYYLCSKYLFKKIADFT
jgi:hypothetical protein